MSIHIAITNLILKWTSDGAAELAVPGCELVVAGRSRRLIPRGPVGSARRRRRRKLVGGAGGTRSARPSSERGPGRGAVAAIDVRKQSATARRRTTHVDRLRPRRRRLLVAGDVRPGRWTRGSGDTGRLARRRARQRHRRRLQTVFTRHHPHTSNKALVTTTTRFLFDFDSTAIRLLIKGH